MSAQVGQIKRRLPRTRAGIIGRGRRGAHRRLAGGNAAPRDRVAVLDESTREPVTGAFPELERVDRGIATKIRTRARPGHAHSFWYVIFNAPENCSDGACGEDDIFINPDDQSGGFNAQQIVATRASSVWGEAGAVANPAGRLKLNGALGRGGTPMARTR